MLMVEVSWGCQFHLNVIATYPHQFNRFFNALFPLSGSFHAYFDQFMSIKNISDLKAQRGQRFISSQHGHLVLSQFGKYVFLAIITAWIYLSNGGDTLFCVLFVVEYQFTSFSLDCLPLCNIWEERT